MKKWQWACASERLGSLSCLSSKRGFPRRTRQSDGLLVQWYLIPSQLLLMFGNYSLSRCVFAIWTTSRLLLGPSRRSLNDVCLPRWPRSRRKLPLPLPCALLIFKFSVTFLGTRIGRDHGPPDRSHLRCSVLPFEHPLSSYSGPSLSSCGSQTAKFQCTLNTPFSFLHGSASHGNATEWFYLSSPHRVPRSWSVGA